MSQKEIHQPIYFKGLNGIRAIAALIVLFCHVDQFSRLFNVPKIGFHQFGMAGYAVDMFFVLSGYLITYLLFVEKEKTKTIDLKKFYLRRILRIWPIYYLSLAITIGLTYFHIAEEPPDWPTSIALYTFFAANAAYVMGLAMNAIAPHWSVGVEEQFYLIWPNLIKRTSNYWFAFISFYFLFVLIKLAVYAVFTPEPEVYFLFAYSSLNIMCVGAMGALLVYTKHPWLKILYRKEMQILSWGVLVYSCVFKPLHLFTFIDQELNSIFYLIIIVNVSSNEKSLVSLENKVMNYLGKISYGIYIYHMLILFLLPQFLAYFNIEVNYLAMVLMMVSISLLTAALSYHFFEIPFLRRKKAYSVVHSTDSGSKDFG